MNKLVVGMLLAVLLLTGCNIEIDFDSDGNADFKSSSEILRGSGNSITKTFDLDGFSALNISHAFEVELNQGDVYAIEIKADDNIMDHIQVKVEDETLVIDLDQLISFSNINTKAIITMPTLTGINLSGASRLFMESDFPEIEEFKLIVSGASTVEGTILCNRMDVNISGSSQIGLKGAGDDINIKASGASSCGMEEFVAKNIDISLSGASNADLNCENSLTGSASGASNINYTGNANSNINVSGASSVKKR